MANFSEINAQWHLDKVKRYMIQTGMSCESQVGY